MANGTGTNEELVEIIKEGEETILRVKSSSNPQNLAAALSHAVYDSKKVSLRAIGAGSVNQAVKACAIARGYVATRGIDLTFKPGFDTIEIFDRETRQNVSVSAIVLHVLVAR